MPFLSFDLQAKEWLKTTKEFDAMQKCRKALSRTGMRFALAFAYYTEQLIVNYGTMEKGVSPLRLDEKLVQGEKGG